MSTIMLTPTLHDRSLPNLDPARGPAMRMHSGRPFYLADPRPEEVHLPDLVWGCGHFCRYGGGVIRSYTVLEHLVLGCQAILRYEQNIKKGEVTLPEPGSALARGALHWLGHDLHEGAYSDVTRPLKELIPDYSALEERGAKAVAEGLGLEVGGGQFAPLVQKYDDAMAEAEMRWLLHPAGTPKWKHPTNSAAASGVRFGHKAASSGYWRTQFYTLWAALGGCPVTLEDYER